jgi:LasA protease
MARSLTAPGASRKNLIRFVALMGLAAAALLPLSVSAKAHPGSSGEGLEAAVVEEMGVESSARSFAEVKDEGRTQVNVMRESGGWAFGTAVIEAPKKRGHYPKGWLFVAEDASEGWNVALEGSPEFSELAADAPANVVNAGEKGTFATGERSFSATATSARTGLRLPWRKGGSWKFTGGPHGWATGYDRPYAALDFAGTTPRDQRVRAAAGGRVYNMCGSKRGWIRVYHPNGYSTDYYHLIRNIKPRAGAAIKRGAYLGLTGNDVSCGGASYGRHVHFALLRNTRHVAVHGKIIGGWKFVQGQAYRGYAQRGKVRRTPGTLIKNFGP